MMRCSFVWERMIPNVFLFLPSFLVDSLYLDRKYSFFTTASLTTIRLSVFV